MCSEMLPIRFGRRKSGLKKNGVALGSPVLPGRSLRLGLNREPAGHQPARLTRACNCLPERRSAGVHHRPMRAPLRLP